MSGRATEQTNGTGRRRRSLDPQGKRALFEQPVAAARDSIRSGPAKEGREALFSSGPRRPGTVVVDCAGCEARSRISLADIGIRLAMASVWLPIRRHPHWMTCPACARRTWCRVAWTS